MTNKPGQVTAQRPGTPIKSQTQTGQQAASGGRTVVQNVLVTQGAQRATIIRQPSNRGDLSTITQSTHRENLNQVSGERPRTPTILTTPTTPTGRRPSISTTPTILTTPTTPTILTTPTTPTGRRPSISTTPTILTTPTTPTILTTPTTPTGRRPSISTTPTILTTPTTPTILTTPTTPTGRRPSISTTPTTPTTPTNNIIGTITPVSISKVKNIPTRGITGKPPTLFQQITNSSARLTLLTGQPIVDRLTSTVQISISDGNVGKYTQKDINTMRDHINAGGNAVQNLDGTITLMQGPQQNQNQNKKYSNTMPFEENQEYTNCNQVGNSEIIIKNLVALIGRLLLSVFRCDK
jgi:hypothetical protein